MKLVKVIAIFVTLYLGLVAGSFASSFYQIKFSDVVYQPQLGPFCHQDIRKEDNWEPFNLWQLQEYAHYCFRVPIEIFDTPENNVIAFNAMFLGSANVYWDGVFLGEKGSVANDIEEEVAGPILFQFPLDQEKLSKGTHILSMEVSTHSHIEDLHSIFYGLYLVDQYRLAEAVKIDLIIPLLLAGVMLFLSVFFQFAYWLYQADKALLIFSFLCLFAGALIALEMVKFVYNYPWTWHVVRLRTILAITACTGVLLNLYYLFYYRISVPKMLYVLVSICFVVIPFLPLSYDGRSVLLFLITTLFALIIGVYAQSRRKIAAKSNNFILVAGLLILLILPFSFVEKWFALVFSFIALANLFNLMNRFRQEREKALLSLQLEAEMLRRNIQPHFIMNSLLMLVEWVETQPKLAVSFIEELADEFRLLNRLSKESLIELTDELSLCQKHLAIMQMRYQQDVKLEIEGETKNVLLPPAIIHTQIENAFAHNKIRAGDVFKVKVIKDTNTIDIAVQTPFRKRRHKGSGTGENYINSRLQIAYGEDWQLVSSQQGESWITQVTLPTEPQPQ